MRCDLRTVAIGAGCLAIGAGGGAAASAIASAGAAPSHAASAVAAQAPAGATGEPAATRPRRARRLLSRAVEGRVVIWTRAGFATISFARGRLDSVAGSSLKLTESTPAHAYRTVTIAIPAGARVRNDGRSASLASLRPGERVVVVRGPRFTLVRAHAPRMR
jgi:hypothetical protein